jgi:hypothetical protein
MVLIVALIGAAIAGAVGLGIHWRWNVMDSRFIWSLCAVLALLDIALAGLFAAWTGSAWALIAVGGAVLGMVASAGFVWAIAWGLRSAMAARLRRGLRLPDGISHDAVQQWAERHRARMR